MESMPFRYAVRSTANPPATNKAERLQTFLRSKVKMQARLVCTESQQRFHISHTRG